MAKKIRTEDIVDKDLFKPTIEQTESLINVLKELENKYKDVLRATKETGKVKTFEDSQKVVSNFEKVTKASENLNKTEKERIRLEEELKRQRSTAIDQNTQLKIAVQEQRKENVRFVKSTTGISGAYAQLSAKLQIARQRFKDLAAQEKQNTKEGQVLLKNIQQLDAKLKQIDASAGQFQRNVGNYTGALGKLRAGFVNVAQAAGLSLGLFGAFRAVRSSVSIITDFEQAIANLGAITGLSGDELERLQGLVLKVSENTGKGAADIAKAFQLVGSAQPELLKNADALAQVTEQAVLLSKAGGISVESAAEALTKSLNQFGASSSEASKFTDILAASQQKGTATIEQLSEALKNVGSVAKASGISFEQTNVLLQALAKGGLTSAEAGTKLRAILLRLAQTGRKELNPATTDFNDILKVLKKEVTDVTKAADLFGQESAAAALTLIDQSGTVKELTGQLNENGSALTQANDRFNTVNGAVEELTGAWDRFIISLNEGNKVTNSLSRIVRFLAENLTTILRVVGTLVTAFITYKTTVIAINNATKLFTGLTNAAKVAMAALNGGIKGATTSFKAFDKATKANILGLLASLISIAASAFISFRDNAREAAEAQRKLNEEATKFNDISSIEERFAIRDRLSKKAIENLKNDINSELDLFDERRTRALQIVADEGKRLRELREQFSKETNQIAKQGLFNEIKAEQERVDALITERTGITKEIIFRERQLKEFLLILERDFKKEQVKVVEDGNKKLSEAEKKRREKAEADALRAAEEEANRLANLEADKVKEKNDTLLSLERQYQEQLKNIRLSAFEDGSKEQLIERQKIINEENQQRKDEINRTIADEEIRQAELVILANETALELQDVQRKIDAIDERERRERIDRNIKTANEIADIYNKQLQERINGLEEEVNASKKREDELKQLAAQGVEDADANIANEKRKQAELEREKQRQAKRQKQLELGLTALNTYNSKVQSGDKRPLQSTIKDLTLLSNFVSNLSGFYEGTEKIEGKGQLNTSKDSHIVRVHTGERIMPSDDNFKTGYMSNEQLADIAYKYRTGELSERLNSSVPLDGSAFYSYEQMNTLIKEIKQLPSKMPKNRTEIDTIRGLIIDILERDGKVVRTKRRLR